MENNIAGDCADELPQPENTSGFSGSDNCMGWPPAENMAGFLGGSDNDTLWAGPMENMNGFPVADMSAAGFSDVYRGLIDEVDLYRPVTEPYAWHHDAGDGALVNTQDDIHNHAVSKSLMKRQIWRWQPYDVKRAIKQVGGVSQEGIHTTNLENQRSNLDLENVMPSSSISTQSITLEDSTKLWVKVEYNNDIVKFLLSLPTNMDGLKTQVLKRYKMDGDALKFMYKDEDGEMITIACDEDLHCCLEYFKSSGIAPVRLSLSVS